LIALVFSIVAVGLDFLLTAHGKSYRVGDEIDATIGFGHKEIRTTVVYQWDDTAIANRTTIVSYSQAYQDICVDEDIRNRNVDSTYCDDLQALEKTGQTYYGFAVVAVVSIAIAVLMASIITIARCACKKPMVVCSFFVSGFATVSVVASSVAMFISWNGFSENAAAVLDVVYAYYYPVAELDTQWDDLKSGPSLICLYVAIAFAFIGMLCIMALERTGCVGQRNLNSRQYPRGGDSPALLEIEGQQPQNWTIQAHPPNRMDTTGVQV
jgi:hypothetical protein